MGFDALFSNMVGNNNTATGYQALANNTADYNTATGYQALRYNTTGTFNTADGVNALVSNGAGNSNTAMGYGALGTSQTGDQNTAIGVTALQSNVNGSRNTAAGFEALWSNQGGTDNTAMGQSALSQNNAGNFNTAYGQGALSTNSTGSMNIAIGANAGANLTTGNNNIDIGNSGTAAESDTIRIGTSQTATFVAGINGVDASAGSPVFILPSGQLGTGSVINPTSGKLSRTTKGTLARLAADNARLKNDLLTERRKVDELKTQIAQQRRAFEKDMAAIQRSLKDQKSELEAVSKRVDLVAPLEVSNPR